MQVPSNQGLLGGYRACADNANIQYVVLPSCHVGRALFLLWGLSRILRARKQRLPQFCDQGVAVLPQNFCRNFGSTKMAIIRSPCTTLFKLWKPDLLWRLAKINAQGSYSTEFHNFTSFRNDSRFRDPNFWELKRAATLQRLQWELPSTCGDKS